MKRIQLLRHAKSSWDDPTLADIDRPLNKRGKRACKTMAVRLAAVDCCFDTVFASPAQRAVNTIERIARQLPKSDIHWQVDDRLYTFASEALLNFLRSLDDRIEAPLIVGHNPALTDVCNELATSGIDNIPTCAYVSLLYDASSWRQLTAGSCELQYFVKPKDPS